MDLFISLLKEAYFNSFFLLGANSTRIKAQIYFTSSLSVISSSILKLFIREKIGTLINMGTDLYNLVLMSLK